MLTYLARGLLCRRFWAASSTVDHVKPDNHYPVPLTKMSSGMAPIPGRAFPVTCAESPWLCIAIRYSRYIPQKGHNRRAATYPMGNSDPRERESQESGCVV